ncbi:polysaccharide deacetylase family protein [Paraglaciecola hydrolytica]|uniref:NodB homology domain-containing protein n=1 Tax=Paraglaciecola hydrolytica TaxID=1799789 RepID=A0A136A099_9ALTE|nr:polysaccharide deacetylase family protein [Paraglaciecola hydrolytica]KXI28678.1 hypothetical protein AX660_16525 [Paraglaciecola hydrolytica]
MKGLVFIFCCLAGLSGCASSGRQTVAQDANFIIIKPLPQDDLTSLAIAYLGHPQDASIIARYNPQLNLSKGDVVAIPKRNFNPAAVYVNGYQSIPILCYHQFSAGPANNSMVVSANNFEQQMAYLQQHDYRVISLQEFHHFTQGQQALPEKSVVITIDDGYKSYLEIAYPILKKYGFASTLFIYPDFIGVGSALNWRDVGFLNNDPLVDIQSHSKSHDNLSPKAGGENSSAYLQRLATEVLDTDKILQQKIQRTAQYFAYPYGNTSQQLIDLLAKQHYQLGLTVKKGSNPTFASPYLLNRTMIYADDNLTTFVKQLDGFKQVNLK